MKKLLIALIGLVLTVFLVATPVAALMDTTINDNHNSHNTDSHDFTVNTEINTKIDNSVKQNADGTQVGGHDNTNVVVNNNGIIGATDVKQGQSQGQSQSLTFIVPEGNPSYYSMDMSLVTSDVQTTSLYLGEVLVASSDSNKLLAEGNTYRYTIKSSIPVLAYVINSLDDDKVRTIDGAPVYDDWNQKYTHGWVDVAKDNKFRSTSQQFFFTVKEPGKYSLVIDTRVSMGRNGIQSKVKDDSVDIAYLVEKMDSIIPEPRVNSIIGTTDMYPILSNGQANTA